MTEEKKLTKEEEEVARKIAPDVNISIEEGRDQIEGLRKKHPKVNFRFAPSDATDDSLSRVGLKVFTGEGGKRLVIGHRLVCEMVDEKLCRGVIQKRFEDSTKLRQSIRDKKTSSRDKTSVKREPVDKA